MGGGGVEKIRFPKELNKGKIQKMELNEGGSKRLKMSKELNKEKIQTINVFNKLNIEEKSRILESPRN